MDLRERKMGIVPRGLVHDFGPKVEVFSTFVFINNSSRKKCLFRFYIEKNAFKALRRSLYVKRNICLFRKGLLHHFRQKKSRYLQLLIFFTIYQEKVSVDVLVRKQVFL